MREDGKRELGKIISAETSDNDHGGLSCWVYIEFKGSGQGFGGLMLDKKLAAQYERDLCEVFGVAKLDDLVGMQCYALRPFGYHNDYIEGLETLDGERFTHTDWRRKQFPDHDIPTRLEAERDRLEGSLAHMTRRIGEIQRELRTLKARYTEWALSEEP